MANKQQSKVRFVRCPKCTKILPEPEHVPLYACGACGAILQAKNYKGPHKHTALGSPEQDVTKRNGIISTGEAGESSGSSQRSSSEHCSPQEEVRNLDVVENSRSLEQNGAANSFDNSSLSKESSSLVNEENGEICDTKIDKICSRSEQNGAANSSENASSSRESSSFKHQEDEEIDGKSERCSKSEHDESTRNGHHSVLSEESDCRENKEIGGIDRNIGQFDSKDRGSSDLPTVLKNDTLKLTKVNSAIEDIGQDDECHGIVTETIHQKQLGELTTDRRTFTQDESIEAAAAAAADDDDDDDDGEKLVRPVRSAKIASSRTESPGTEKPTQFASDSAEKYASDLQQPEVLEQLHLPKKKSHQDVSRNGINLHALESKVVKLGKENVKGTNPIKDASLLMESPELTQQASESTRNHDAFDREASEGASESCHVKAAHVQQDVSGSGIYHHDADGTEAGSFSKENGNGADPKAIVEQLERVQISSAPSLSKEFIQDEIGESVGASNPTSVSDLKKIFEMGPTNVPEDHLHLLKRSFDNAKGTSKQNFENVGESDVYVDKKVGMGLKERSFAYDGNVSSCDENDDKVANQPSKVNGETLSPNNAVADSDATEESPEWNNFPSEQMIFSNVRAPRQSRRSTSMALDEELKTGIKEGKGLSKGNEFTRRYDKVRRNGKNLLPRGPYRRRSSEITYETGSTCSYALHDELPRHQMHPHHPYGRRLPEAPLWREMEFLPLYYNSETSGEFADRPRHHSYTNRRQIPERMSRSGVLPRNPYSAEMSNGRYHHVHRYPENRRWSAQLPPPAYYSHHDLYMDPEWEPKRDPYDSYSTSPQRLYLESKSSYAWGHDAISLSDDLRHKDHIMRMMYLREKREAVKTSFYPIVGGTPFISCYFCFHILQIPRNFLLSKRSRRRTHKLMCGACSRVLEFVLENEGGLTPCQTNHNENASMSVPSHSSVNHSRQSSVNFADRRILLSRDSFGGSNRERRKLEPGSSSKVERTEGLNVDDDDDDDAPHVRGRPPKVTWQVPARSKSPLHKLMGYSSPKEMLAFHESDDVE